MSFNHKLVEAKLALRKIEPGELTNLARDLLEAGFDGPSILHLASLLDPSGWETDLVLSKFMEEAGLKQITHHEAVVRLARDFARRIVAENSDPLSFTRDFLDLWVNSDYSKTLQEAGCLDDRKALADALGQTEAELRDYARQVLLALASENRDDN